MTSRGRRRGFVGRFVLVLALAAFACCVSCSATGFVAHAVASATGNTGDVSCDRRFVTGVEAAGFCQEVVGTVAVSAIRDDCQDKHKAKAFRGRCPNERKIAGCKLSLLTEDGSEVFDWYYDVHELERNGQVTFKSRAESIEDVRRQCADSNRYEEGAELVLPADRVASASPSTSNAASRPTAKADRR